MRQYYTTSPGINRMNGKIDKSHDNLQRHAREKGEQDLNKVIREVHGYKAK